MDFIVILRPLEALHKVPTISRVPRSNDDEEETWMTRRSFLAQCWIPSPEPSKYFSAWISLFKKDLSFLMLRGRKVRQDAGRGVRFQIIRFGKPWEGEVRGGFFLFIERLAR